MTKVYLAIILTIASLFIGYYYLHDFSIVAIIFITLTLLFAWLLKFPSEIWLKIPDLQTRKNHLGEKKPSIMTYDKNIETIIHDYTDLKDFSVSESRIHDSVELIEDTQEAIIKTLIPYCLILLSAVFTYFKVKDKIASTSYDDLVYFKNFSTLTYLGVAFCYIAWFIAPVIIQKKKNKLMSRH